MVFCDDAHLSLKDLKNFKKKEALIDLGRIGITLNKQSKQIADLKQQLVKKENNTFGSI